MNRLAFASYSADSRQMLAVWFDRPPEVCPTQRDPDAWAGAASRSDFMVSRLSELVFVPNPTIRWLDSAASLWWCKIEQGRRLAASRARSERSKAAQTLFDIPVDVEEEGRRAGLERAYARGRR